MEINAPVCGTGIVINLFSGRTTHAPMMKFRVEGDALYSPGAFFSVAPGEVLLCRTDFLPHEVTCRCLVVVRIRSTGKVYARFVCDHPSYGQTRKLALKPVNLNSPTLIVERDDVEIIGLVERRV